MRTVCQGPVTTPWLGASEVSAGPRGYRAAREDQEVTMASQHAIDEVDIRQPIERGLAAIRAMDLEPVLALSAPHIVSYDLDPPLRYTGADGKRKRWEGIFAAYQRPIGYEIHDLAITLGDDVAFGHSLNRIRGTLKNGSMTDFWLRWTACFRKIESNWLIAHDHVSVPIDVETRAALLNLEP
jgi:ketosteroid isomerase-like protein